MKVVFLGCTKYSETLLKTVMELKSVEIQAIFSIPEYFSISYSKEKVLNSNYADLQPYARELDVPYYLIDSVEGQRMKDYKGVLEELKPDVLLVLGWYYMIPKSIRELAKLGSWGIHASLLPKYAGGAPLVWAIIEGEKKTGVSLFRMDDGVDDGDLIAQKAFPIEYEDTIKDVYYKATEASKNILQNILGNPKRVTFTPQDKDKIEVYPQRSPKDGEINWDWNRERIYNFIRAQSRPYPGAWTIIGRKKVTIWFASIEELPSN